MFPFYKNPISFLQEPNFTTEFIQQMILIEYDKTIFFDSENAQLASVSQCFQGRRDGKSAQVASKSNPNSLLFCWRERSSYSLRFRWGQFISIVCLRLPEMVYKAVISILRATLENNTECNTYQQRNYKQEEIQHLRRLQRTQMV